MKHLSWAALEVRRWWATPTRLLLVLAPLVATALSLGVYAARTARNLPVGVVDLDRSSLSRALVRDMAAAPQLRVVTLADPAAAYEDFRQGRIRAAVVLANGMDRDVRTGRTARMLLLRDATNPVTSNQIYAAMAAIAATEGARLEAGRLMVAGLSLSQAKDMALPLRTDPRPISNPSFDYLSNFAPGLFPMFLQMALMLAAGTMLPHGWRRSAHPLRELAGRSLPWIAVYALAALAYYRWLLPFWGAPATPFWGTSLLLFLLLAASLSCGAVFGRYIKSPVKAGQFLLAFNTPAFPFSGYTFPEWAMPPVLTAITRPLPFSLFVDAYRDLAGWATQRPLAGWIGLAVWACVSIGLLCIPGRQDNTETEIVDRPNPVTGGFLHALKRELLRLTRTPGLSTLFVAAPLLYLALYGFMYADKTELRIPLAVTGGMESSVARELSRSLSAHAQLRVEAMTPTDARVALSHGEVRGVLEIPSDLDLRLRRREATAIPLLFVADRFLPANDLQRSIGEVLTNLGGRERLLILEAKGANPMAAAQRANALQLDDRPLGNPRETYGDFMLPVLGFLILHQLCLVASAFASAASAGAHRAKDFAARLLLCGLWYGAWFALWVGVVLPAMSVPIDARVAPMALLCAMGLVASGLMGSAVGILIGEAGVSVQLLAFTSYPFFFTTGASWPKELFPAILTGFGNLVPLKPWIEGGNRVLRLGATFADIVPQMVHLGALLAGWSLVLWAAVAWSTKKNDRPAPWPERSPRT